MSKEPNITKRRLASSYITSMISISMVLLSLGVIGFLLLNAKKLGDFIKEQNNISIYFRDNVKEVDIRLIQKKMDAKPYTKSTLYISKEEGARQYIQEIGEDFISILEENPLPASVDVKLYANYVHNDSIAKIVDEFSKYPEVDEIVYHETLVHVVNDNIKTITLYVLGFSLIFLLIAIVLINNTIRLSVYSKRFIIRTMQLVGATNSFIRKPFVFRGTLHGIYSAMIAIGFLSGIIYFMQDWLEGSVGFQHIESILVLFGTVMFIGIFISWTFTFFAVNKFLKIKIDNLYF